MCEYCKLFSGDTIILAEDGETELKMERHNKEYSLVAEGLTDIAETRINYCPMCGRKLKEDYHMTKEQAIERLKKLDYLLDDVYSTGLVEDEERNKYQDAIETVLPMLEEKDKEEVKQYFENKAKELLNK